MALPIFVGDTKANSSATSSLVVARSCSAGNALVLGVALSDGSQSVSAITDSAGSVLGVPVNTWQKIATQNLLNTRIEYWACRSNTSTGAGIAAITSLTIALSGSQSIAAILGEYSGVNAFGVSATAKVNTSQNPFPWNNIVLEISEQAVPQQIMVSFFSVLDEAFTGPIAGSTIRDSYSLSSGPIPSIALVEQGTTDPNNLLDTGVQINEIVQTPGPPVVQNIPTSTLQGITLLLSGGLTLRSIPGFTDVPDSTFATGQPVRGINLAKISENAEFGMVRFEVFSGTYKDGDTVDLPVSPVDGYEYSREELVYAWAISSSVDPATGWASAQEALWYAQWWVDQWEGPDSPGGGVHSNEWYTWIHSNQPNTQTSDGVLQVFVFAQRGSGGSYTAQPGVSGYDFPGGANFTSDLTMAATASYSPIADSSFAQDDPLTQALAQQMNKNAKFGAVNVEAFYMGEYINGETVPQCVSPVDGYVYPYADTVFVPCWRWTTDGTVYSQPTSGLFFQEMDASVNGSGVVSAAVYIWGGGPVLLESGWGRVSVVAICQRPMTGTPYTLGNQFSEIDLVDFMPDTPLDFELLKQINDNTQESVSSPEIFGPTNYTNGSTVALPVSTRDGYQYSRSELFYVWSIHQLPGPGGNVRIITMQTSVNSAGLVTVEEYQLPHGGVGTLYTVGSIDVTVIAIRNGTGRLTPTSLVGGSGSVTAPPDLASPTPGGVASITVNGV